jgi:hypothetical protein
VRGRGEKREAERRGRGKGQICEEQDQEGAAREGQEWEGASKGMKRNAGGKGRNLIRTTERKSCAGLLKWEGGGGGHHGLPYGEQAVRRSERYLYCALTSP